MSPEQQIDRSVLAGKDREELHTIAGAIGVKAATRMRKADLIDAILDAANGGTDTPAPAAANDAPKPRRVRSARASQLANPDPIAALAAEEESLGAVDEPESAVDAMPRPRTRRASVSTGADDPSASNGTAAADSSKSEKLR